MGAVVPSRIDASVLSVSGAYVPGQSIYGASGVTTTAAQMLNPASNVNGCIIRTAGIYAPSGAFAGLFVGTAAPTNAINATAGARQVLVTPISGGAHLQWPLLIPAGWGVWAISGAAGAGAFMTYDLQ